MTQTSQVHNTLIGAIWPSTDRSNALMRNVVLALVGTLFLTLSAKIQVPLWPVPMT